MAEKPISMMRSDSFDPGRYRDDDSDRVRRAAEQEAEGIGITTASGQPPVQIIGLFGAVKRSPTKLGNKAEPAGAARMKGGPKRAELESGGKKRSDKSGTGG